MWDVLVEEGFVCLARQMLLFFFFPHGAPDALLHDTSTYVYRA